ncbi:unnamed protein product [Cylicocyclus nassatus]|uniref:Uncharacterized protein n=1 Tax=Cylicocyclus nassatus TaxID=53992 RepID=A0AA36GKN8_CYLNA|nr:unnamed protein product [Cylicocyclus nassatus]
MYGDRICRHVIVLLSDHGCPVIATSFMPVDPQNHTLSECRFYSEVDRKTSFMSPDSSVLAETMSKCTDIVAEYQTLDESLVGNVLLLAGELIRSHNMRTNMLLQSHC